VRVPRAAEASVPTDKLEGYVLKPDHPDNRGKAKGFAALGFTVENAAALRAELLAAVRRSPPVKVEDAHPWGWRRYRLETVVTGPAGRRALVRSIWWIDREGDAPRLVSSYVRGRADR
jgi:hypothetical protein